MINTSEIIKHIPADKFNELMKGNKSALTKEASFAVQIISGNNKLQQCSHESVIKAVWNVAVSGLTLNPLKGLAYLTPRWNSAKNQNECVLMPSYRGLQSLAQEGGHIRTVQCYLVHEGDEFDYQLGLNPDIKHRPKGGNKITHAYAYAKLQTGEVQIEVMTIDEMHLIRDMSDGWKAFSDGKAKSAIWNDHEGEMCRKTVVKRLLKYLPKIDNPYLYEAMKLDNVEYKATDGQKFKIENMLRTSTLDHEQAALIESNIDNLTQEEASDIIANLEQNQQGLNELGVGSQTAIHKQLDKMEGKS
jgi:recombination protein RecT